MTIAASGSTIEKHPKLAQLIADFIKELLPEDDQKFRFMLAEDGAGKGACYVAAIASEYLKTKSPK